MAERVQRTVVLAVGDVKAEDTTMLWRYSFAHLLSENDRVVVVHARTNAPTDWLPLNVGQNVAADEARWLPDEMRDGLKSFKTAEYWSLKGSSVAEAISEFLAHRVAADLLVVGSRGASGIKRALTGSISKSILEAVDVAVCIVRAGVFVKDSPPFRLPTASGAELASPLPHLKRSRNIAMALDGSDVSSVLVAWASQLLLRRADRVTLLHSSYGLDEFATLAAAGQLAACAAALRKVVGSSETGAQEEAVTVQRLPEHSSPAHAIQEALEKQGPFDLLLVGSRGLSAMGKLKERLLGSYGSVSSALVKNAPAPVLVLSKGTLVEWLERAAVPPETPLKGAPQAA